tara:strand:+ start:221542 stop:222375 length:834 start_codon:yes stop_codon:yes gene_type:complete
LKICGGDYKYIGRFVLACHEKEKVLKLTSKKVMKFEEDGVFDSFESAQTINVQARCVGVEEMAHDTSPLKESQKCYAHHSYYGEGYASPELPLGVMPYSSIKAKSMMMLFSFSLIAITLSFVQTTQAKMNSVQLERHKYEASVYRNQSQKVAQAMDMMALNTQAFEDSMAKMGKVVESRKALAEVETALHKQSVGNQYKISDKEARQLLIRAGYQPSQINERQMASFKKNYEGVDGDVDFARDVASEIVQEEVESFVHKMKMISSVGSYIYNRVQDE